MKFPKSIRHKARAADAAANCAPPATLREPPQWRSDCRSRTDNVVRRGHARARPKRLVARSHSWRCLAEPRIVFEISYLIEPIRCALVRGRDGSGSAGLRRRTLLAIVTKHRRHASKLGADPL